MNFKTKFLAVMLIISVFLLSSCEVYQTLYGTAPKPTGQVVAPPEKETQKEMVVRVEGEKAKDPAMLAKTVYSAASPVNHDPFKVGENPLGPFEKGQSLGFTLGDWLDATGSGTYTVERGNARLNLSFEKLVPNGVYTLWCSRLTLPPNFTVADKPCGAADGSENSFIADASGNADFGLNLKPLEESTKETSTVISLSYHSDEKTHGASPGDFGLNSHVQLFFLLPAPTAPRPKITFEIPVKMASHIDANLPEQDVFVEEELKMEQPKEEAKEQKKEEYEETKPEATESMQKEKPIVIVVQETDLVSLTPKAEDPDKNTNLVFTFTSPLNEKGEWQTTYGDSGEYTMTITASDGELTASKDVLVIVNKKEEPPTIDSAKPIESGLNIDENQAVQFSVAASDLNKDPLTYTWKVDGAEAGNGNDFTYQTTYDDAGTHTVKVDASDSISSSSKLWSVTVKNVNRKPVLEKIDDIKAKETDRIVITALATDADNDKITYSISDNRFTQEDNVFTLQTDHDSAGVYDATISASDGQDTTSQTFKVDVENVDRPPVILDIVQKK